MKPALLILFLLLPALQSLHAQPGAIDATFNPTDLGFGNGDGGERFLPHLCALLPDGKTIIGGLWFCRTYGHEKIFRPTTY